MYEIKDLEFVGNHLSFKAQTPFTIYAVRFDMMLEKWWWTNEISFKGGPVVREFVKSLKDGKQKANEHWHNLLKQTLIKKDG
jgi:hypothetical protein